MVARRMRRLASQHTYTIAQAAGRSSQRADPIYSVFACQPSRSVPHLNHPPGKQMLDGRRDTPNLSEVSLRCRLFKLFDQAGQTALARSPLHLGNNGVPHANCRACVPMPSQASNISDMAKTASANRVSASPFHALQTWYLQNS